MTKKSKMPRSKDVPSKNEVTKEELHYPEKQVCFAHNDTQKSPVEDCPHCKKLNHELRQQFLAKHRDVAYRIIYPNWKKYYDASREYLNTKYKHQLPEGKTEFDASAIVDVAMRSISSDLRPWKGSVGCAVWREVLEELAMKLHSSYVPVQDKTGEALW